MGVLYLVRHGETVWNREQRYQGQQDIPLSEQGILQGQAVAQYFRNQIVDAVFSSDLSRAYQTATLIAQPHGLQVKQEVNLREYCFGVWEGLNRAEVKDRYHDLYKRRQKDINTEIPGGESAHQMLARINIFLEQIIKSDYSSVVAVAHGGSIRAIVAHVLGLELTKSFRLKLDNSGVTSINWKNSSQPDYQLLTINSVSHLHDITSL